MNAKWFTKDEVWEVVIMTVAAALFLLLFGGVAGAAEIEPFVQYQHTSDLFRGCPFRCDSDEPKQEFISGGVTINAGKRRAWEIDIAHGIKAVDCPIKRCSWEQGSQLGVRYYPFRGR